MTFKQKLVPNLQEVYINSFLSNELPESMTIAIITLLYKKQNPKYLKNWRPISLLNHDYKILAKILSNRFKTTLSTIIHHNQACGVPGREIHDHLYLLSDLFEYHSDNRTGGALITLDQEKAIDRLEINYLIKTLEAFGYGENIIKWIQLIYKTL